MKTTGDSLCLTLPRQPTSRAGTQWLLTNPREGGLSLVRVGKGEQGREVSPSGGMCLVQLTPKTHWGEALLPSARAFLPVTWHGFHHGVDDSGGQTHSFPTTAPLPSQTWVKPCCRGFFRTFMVASSGSLSFEVSWRAGPHLGLVSPYS